MGVKKKKYFVGLLFIVHKFFLYNQTLDLQYKKPHLLVVEENISHFSLEEFFFFFVVFKRIVEL